MFRILLGCVLMYDLLRRFPDAGLLWSSDGVMSSAALRKMPQHTPQASFLFWFTSTAQVQTAFAGLGVVFALYGAGLATRVMQVLALAGYCSLNARNLFFEDGGTGCTILLLCWTLLLPLGDRFSADALLRDARRARIAERVAVRRGAQQPVYTLALLAVLLQAAVIYWLNAVHKSGHTWKNGDAVHLVLWQHRVNTPFALWLAAHEPTWFSPLSTWLTKRTELVLPVLLLWPSHPLRTRGTAFVLAVLLHGGIALTLTLGPFSYSMICLLWLAVPGDAWSELGRVTALRRAAWRLAHVRARTLRSLRRSLFATSSAPRELLPASWRARLPKLREVAVGLMIVVEGANVLASNRAFPKGLRLQEPEWLLAYKPYVRGWQAWSMFAPDAPRDDGTMVVDAVTSRGRHLDPFTGLPPDFEQIRRGLAPHPIALSDYFFALRDKRHAQYRRELSRYLKRYRVPGAGDERLRAFEVYWVSYVPPPRGSYVPGPLKKQSLWRVKL